MDLTGIKTMLGVSFVVCQVFLAGVFGFQFSEICRATIPVIIKKTCTQVTYKFDVKHHTPYLAGRFYMYDTEEDWGFPILGGESIQTSSGFSLYVDKRSSYFDHTSLRADPIPKHEHDRFTIFLTFRFPDDRNKYRLSLDGYAHADDGVKTLELKSPLRVGKSRCFPQDGIIGCDPYCTCDTVVRKICQGTSPIIGKCLDAGDITRLSANYTFNETCGQAQTPEPTSQTNFSPKPTSPATSTSKPFSSTTYPKPTSKAASQTLSVTMRIGIGAITGFVATGALIFYTKKKTGVPLLVPTNNNYQDIED